MQLVTKEYKAFKVIKLSNNNNDNNAILTSKLDFKRPFINRRHAVLKLILIRDDANYKLNYLLTSSLEISLLKSTSQVTYRAVPRDTANRNLV